MSLEDYPDLVRIETLELPSEQFNQTEELPWVSTAPTQEDSQSLVRYQQPGATWPTTSTENAVSLPIR
jgi:hypothetical protein